jgi:hypothetical protein
MPRPIFDNQQQRGMSLQPGPRARQAAAQPGKLLTTPRSARYLAAIGKLDSSTTMTQVELQDVIDAIHREFADKWSAVPEGFVGHCYLGPPYEAHTLTIDGQIIEHYQSGQPLPGPLEEARSLARTEHYLVIEVYTDRLVCVRTDGSVVTMGGS